MASARFALKNLQQRASFLPRNATHQEQKWGSQFLRRLSASAVEENPPPPEAVNQVAVAEGGKKSDKVFPRKRSGKRGLWRSNNRDFFPAPWEFFPTGLGNALLQATENINRVMENLAPSHLFGGLAKEHDDSYKFRYQMPGLGKEDVKITVEDGVLNIRGEHKEEAGEEGSSEDEFWSAKTYGYYNASIVLPEDAKVDEIKAEMKDGVLNIVVPKSEEMSKDVKEVEVQ